MRTGGGARVRARGLASSVRPRGAVRTGACVPTHPRVRKLRTSAPAVARSVYDVDSRPLRPTKRVLSFAIFKAPGYSGGTTGSVGR